ncbi:hypothetical protein MHBO_002444 [Bonamia ostreae]|uniref:Immunoglobulin I-set domain-containing protein n=1 Tax=Bonamia ostreae TaxID=126728 RepID=A0ABV2AME3_9EUKA
MEMNKGIRQVAFRGEIKSKSSLKPVIWLKNGEVLNISDGQKISSRHLLDKATLHISYINKSDEGEYQLVAENTGGEGKSNPIMLQIERGILHCSSLHSISLQL